MFLSLNHKLHIYVTDENLAITMFGGVYSLVMGGTDYDNQIPITLTSSFVER